MSAQMAPVWVAVVGALAAAVITPVVTAWLAHLERREAWRRQDHVAAELRARLAQIHTLVNSNMTVVLQGELDAVDREQQMMEELIAERRGSGTPPTPDVLARLAALKHKAQTLRANMAERVEQTAAADAEREPPA